MKEHNTEDDEKRTNWKSIYVATVLSFVGAVQYHLFFSALWPYLETIDKTATEEFYGYIIATYSIAQMITAPLFGFWSNKIRQVRLPLFVGLFLMFLGNCIYLSMKFIPIPAKYILLIGRLATGAGSANSSMLRTYASTASTTDDRHKAVGYISCGQALGVCLGPGFQLLFSLFGYPGIGFIEHLRMNLYTAPAYFAIIVNIAGAIILFFGFKEDYAGIIERKEEAEENKNFEDVPMYDLVAVIVCLATRFAQVFFHANFETMGSAFSMIMFDFTETTAVKFMAAAQTGVGIMTLGTYLIYMFFHLEKRINPRKICITALIAFTAFYIITYSWPFIPGNVTTRNSSAKSDAGCDAEKFSWCNDLSPINVYLYYVVYVVVIGFAYPLLNVTVTTLYSKVLGPRRQGTQQGIFQMSGGIARCLGPLGLSILYTNYGPRMTWKVEVVVLALVVAAWMIFYRRMVPLKYNGNNKNDNEETKPMREKSPERTKKYIAPPPYEKVPKFEEMIIAINEGNSDVKERV